MANYTGYKNNTISQDKSLYVGVLSTEKKITDIYISFEKESLESEGVDTVFKIDLNNNRYRYLYQNKGADDFNLFKLSLIKTDDEIVLKLCDNNGDDIFYKDLSDDYVGLSNQIYVYFYCYVGYFQRNYAELDSRYINIDEYTQNYILYLIDYQSQIDSICIPFFSNFDSKIAFYNILTEGI